MRGLCFPSQHCCLPAACSSARAHSRLVIFVVTLLRYVHLGLCAHKAQAKVSIREETVSLFNMTACKLSEALFTHRRWNLAGSDSRCKTAVFGINTIANNSTLTPFTHDTTVLRWGQQSWKIMTLRKKSILGSLKGASVMNLKTSWTFISMAWLMTRRSH